VSLVPFIGTYAVGLSALGSQKYSIVALEVLALPASLFMPFFT